MHLNPKVCLLLLGLLLTGCNYDPYKSICQITVPGGQGSGSLIAVDGDKALVLTCRHVAQAVDTSAKVEWLSDGDQVTHGKVISVVVGTDFKNDLALIVCDAPRGIKPLRVARFHQSTGPYHSVGFRGGQLYESIALEGSESDGLITLSEPFVRGMSGGPVLDRFGRVVGVVVGSDLVTFGVAADGEYLASLLAAHTK